MKITALTSCCVDYFPAQDKVYVGGNSLNFATQCKRSGIEEVSVIGAVGKDRFGILIESHLNKVNVDSSRLYTVDESTASNKIFLNAEGDRYFKADSWQGGAFDVFRLSPNDWDFLSDRTIVAMPAGDPNLKELLKRRNEQQLVVIDFLDYLGIEYIAEFINSIDIVFLSGKDEMLADLKLLATQSGKMIVATLGAEGSIAFHQDKVYRQEAIAVRNIMDTTGCGDSFQAAFSIEWIRSKDIQQCLAAGAIAASTVLGFMGGVE